MSPTVKQYDTYPPWVFALSDDEGPITLSGASSVKIIMKVVGATGAVGPLNASITGEQTFTASSVIGSPTLTSISSLTSIIEGSTLIGSGVAPNATVLEIDPYANTIQMSAPATATVASMSVIANRGMISYTPTSTDTSVPGVYNIEASIHWDAGGTQITKVPNQQNANPQLQIDPDLLGTTE